MKEDTFFMLLILYALWLILNAHFAFDTAFLEIALIGIPLTAVLYFFTVRFTRWTFSFDVFFMKNIHRLILYALILLKSIFTSNFMVISMIVKPHENPEPIIVTFDVPLKDEMLRTMLANSITLTPGTITISCTEDHYIVHCLKREYIDGIENSALVKLLIKMEASKNVSR